MNRLQHIMEQIRTLEAELVSEIQEKEKEFFYRVRGNRVHFDPAAGRRQKAQIQHLFRFLSETRALTLLTAPVIWFCLVPLVFMDVVVTGYQSVCFRVYGIPRVKRADYVIIDHQFLAYLNLIEKINCIYCGYANGVIAYAQEIAARTEQYWCPIKHARRILTRHSRYHKFIDYGDASTYRRTVEEVRRDFRDLSAPPAGIPDKPPPPDS